MDWRETSECIFFAAELQNSQLHQTSTKRMVLKPGVENARMRDLMMAIMRKANCSCLAVTATTQSQPTRVVACNCLECQKWTGSPFDVSVSVWFKSEDSEIQGALTSYTRGTTASMAVRFSFCPQCGTTLFYTADIRPDLTSLPIGTFGDPDFPAPVRSI